MFGTRVDGLVGSLFYMFTRLSYYMFGTRVDGLIGSLIFCVDAIKTCLGHVLRANSFPFLCTLLLNLNGLLY